MPQEKIIIKRIQMIKIKEEKSYDWFFSFFFLMSFSMVLKSSSTLSSKDTTNYVKRTKITKQVSREDDFGVDFW